MGHKDEKTTIIKEIQEYSRPLPRTEGGLAFRGMNQNFCKSGR